MPVEAHANRISKREQVLTTIRTIARNPGANEAALVDCLFFAGYKKLEAELLVAFVPLGLARAVIKRLPITLPSLSDHALVLRDNRRLEVPLMLVPEFVAALQVGEETLTSGIISKEDFTQAASLSVELRLINQALFAGTTLTSIAAPVLIQLGETPGFEEWYRRQTGS